MVVVGLKALDPEWPIREADGSVEIAWSCAADGRLNLRWTEFRRAGRHTADAPRGRHAHFGKIAGAQLAVGCVLIGAIKGSSAKLRCPCRDRSARPTDLPGPAARK